MHGHYSQGKQTNDNKYASAASFTERRSHMKEVYSGAKSHNVSNCVVR